MHFQFCCESAHQEEAWQTGSSPYCGCEWALFLTMGWTQLDLTCIYSKAETKRVLSYLREALLQEMSEMLGP